MIPTSAPPPVKKPFYKNLTVQVLTAIAIGATIGAIWPDAGQAMQPLADGFIRLVKMVVGPIIFLTIVVGIASMGDLKKVGRVGLKALIYFEVVTTIALGIGLLVSNILQPGKGVDASAAFAARQAATTQTALPPVPATQPATNQPSNIPATASPTTQLAAANPATHPTTMPSAAAMKALEDATKAKQQSFVDFLLNIIPDNIVGAFAKGDLLQILFFSVVFGVAVASLGLKSSRLMVELEHLVEVMFRVVGLIMKVAPLGAMGAMAFTVGKFGLKSLLPLLKLMGCVYLTMGLFIFIVLGFICWSYGFSLWRYLVFIREEILLVLGTSSSEPALPRMIEKMELMGCSRSVVGLVIPAGYSFNLDGTSIYLSMAVLFIAQALNIPMDFGQQIAVMVILMITSKGAAAVTGAGFVTLAATLNATHILPVEGLVLLVGVDRFMSEARAITNLIGNGVATLCISKWEGEFNRERYEAAISGRSLAIPAGDLPIELQADIAREGAISPPAP